MSVLPLLILASSSPRRVELLKSLGYPFEIIPADVDEVHEEIGCLRRLTETNAAMKADKIAKLRPEALVVAADTLVSIDGQPLAKPADLEEATRMLAKLSGRQHEVVTAVSLRCAERHVSEDFLSEAKVSFQTLTPEVIAEYLKVTSPLDKAGGYGIQDRPDLIVAEVEGELNGIIGLPTGQLGEVLRRLSQTQTL